MSSINAPAFPVQADIRIRQGDLGRSDSVSTIGLFRCLEDARIRLRMSRFDRLVRAGEFGPFQTIFVSQSAQRLARIRRAGNHIQVHTGIRRIGRSSFTYEQAVFAGAERVGTGTATVLLLGAQGPLALPDELIADLTEWALPEANRTVASRPEASRRSRDYYSYFAPLRARIGDVDANQHVNYIAQIGWYDEAVAAFTTAALNASEAVPDQPPSAYRVDYLGEVTYPGDYEIALHVRTFDADTVNYELGIFRGGTCLGIAEALGARGQLPAEVLSPR